MSPIALVALGLVSLTTLISMACTAQPAETPAVTRVQKATQTPPMLSPTLTAEPTDRTPTTHSTFASFAVACGKLVAKERRNWLRTDRVAFAEWEDKVNAEIPPPELASFWEARKEYFAWFPREYVDYTPPAMTRAQEFSMRQAAAISPDAREALFEGGCLDRREWETDEKRAAARERLNAMRETPLESIEDFAQACKDIVATAPKPTNLNHRVETLQYIVTAWEGMVPSSDFENLYVALVHSYGSALADELPGLEPLEPLDFETEELDAEFLASIQQAGC